ncbi:MAG: hypothetical protein R8K21_06350 [Mariprofundales bacterium]
MIKTSHSDEKGVICLMRRGLVLGWVIEHGKNNTPDTQEIIRAWRNNEPLLLVNKISSQLCLYSQAITTSHLLMERVTDGEFPSDIWDTEPWLQQWSDKFDLLGSSVDQADEQEIEKIDVDVIDNGEVIAEELWIKAAWLSLHDDDDSIRFRFSFGYEGDEDVCARPQHQQYAALLCEAIFPECAVVSADKELADLLAKTLGVDKLLYSERIIYFNAPNGGAQFHHDVESGHHGVVYAQLSGKTVWLSLRKDVLMAEMQAFTRSENGRLALEHITITTDKELVTELLSLCANTQKLSQHLDDRQHDAAELLLDRTPAFIHYLIEQGYGLLVNQGDVLLLPQADLQTCVWHSVFCAGDEVGEALSFAMRGI